MALLMKIECDVDTPSGISTILSSADFEPILYPERHSEIAKALGFDVSEVVRVAKHIPLLLRGTAHLETRKRLAVLIATGARPARKATEELLPTMISDLLKPGSRDVMQHLVNPFVGKIMSAMVGLELQLAGDTMISRLFSQNIGVSKRRRMNTEFGSLRAQIEAKMPDLTEIEVGDRVALCVLGMDSLRGTLGCSLHEILSAGSSQNIDTVTATHPPRTGVPFVDRQAINPVELESKNHAAGTTFRAWLDTYECASSSRSRQRLFGFGAHTCLGRTLSLEIWKTTTDALQQNPATVEILEYDLRRDDVFHIPENFKIEVSHARHSKAG
jgi:hypothetical protein